MKAVYNGISLPIETCAQQNKDGSCLIEDFLNSLSSNLFIGDDHNLKEMCAATPGPDDFVDPDDEVRAAAALAQQNIFKNEAFLTY